MDETPRERRRRDARYLLRWPTAAPALACELNANRDLEAAQAVHSARPTPESEAAVTQAEQRRRQAEQSYHKACHNDSGAWEQAHQDSLEEGEKGSSDGE